MKNFKQHLTEAKEYILWGLPKGKTDALYQQILSTQSKTPAQVEEVKRRAAKEGWHSFRVQILDMSEPFKWDAKKMVNRESYTISERRKSKNTTEIAKQVPVKSDAELNALCVAASKKHAGSYILAYTDFGLATIFKTDKLPTNAYASDDWKAGYWKDGKRFKWSEARIAAAQRATDRLSGLQ
jgi:hypothetical protein